MGKKMQSNNNNNNKKKMKKKKKNQKNENSEFATDPELSGTSNLEANSSSEHDTADKNGEISADIAERSRPVDIADLLFTQETKYLVKVNGIRVRPHQLKGKFLGIFLLKLSPRYTYSFTDQVNYTYNLIDMYEQLKDHLEVVFVATDNLGCFDYKLLKRYRDLISIMPWPAIEYYEFEARKHVQTILGTPDYPTNLVLINPSRHILRNINTLDILKFYGADAFPFTPERVLELRRLDGMARTDKATLQELLCLPVRQFVISNDGKEVPISTIKDKTVGLFLYRENDACNQLADKLKSAYELHNQDFEVLLIHLHMDKYGNCRPVREDSFWKIFKNMPWLALPFKDPTCRKLWYIFEYLHSEELYSLGRPKLVIVKPDGSLERYGTLILERYGNKACPFTREKVAEIELAEMKKLTLTSLLQNPGYLLRGKHELDVNKLVGKRVILLFGQDLSFGSNLLLWTLRNQYRKSQGTEKEFEVVYISMCEKKCDYDACRENLPWLVYPYNSDSGEKLFFYFFDCYPWPGVGLVAFGQDGCIVAKSCFFNYMTEEYDIGCKAFPFIDNDLKAETLMDVRNTYPD